MKEIDYLDLKQCGFNCGVLFLYEGVFSYKTIALLRTEAAVKSTVPYAVTMFCMLDCALLHVCIQLRFPLVSLLSLYHVATWWHCVLCKYPIRT